MIGKGDGKIPEAITRYINWHYTGSLHYYISKVLPLLFFQMTKVPLRGQKSVRNQSETGQTQPLFLSLSLPCLFPHPLTRTPTPTPIPISTTTTATASAAGTTVSFPDCFRTAQAYFAPKFEIECVHAWILTLITRTLLLLLLLPPHPLLLHHHYH